MCPLGLHFDIPVGQVSVVNRRDDGRGHVLQPFETIERRVGLHGIAADARVQLTQPSRGAHERPAGAQACYKVRQAAFGLAPDFVGRAVVVGLPVVFVAVLVGVEVAPGLIRGQLARLADGAVRAVGRVGPNDVCAIGGKNAFALRRHIGRHAERDGEAQRRAQQRVGDAGVAAGGVEQVFARAGKDASCGVRCLHNGGRSTVLDAAARVSPLGFAQYLNTRQVPGQLVESQQRGIAHPLVRQAAERARHGRCLVIFQCDHCHARFQLP